MSQPYSGLSLWLEQAGDLTPRAALPGALDLDIAVVGAGFTDLWSAYYLKRADPSLRLAVIEKEIAAYGLADAVGERTGRSPSWVTLVDRVSRLADK